MSDPLTRPEQDPEVTATGDASHVPDGKVACPTSEASADTLPPPPPPAPPALNLDPFATQNSSAPRPVGPVGLPAVPGYAVEAELGRGGMGVVYKARHLRLGRTVALKMVLAGARADPDELLRFLHEAETAARLQHPHIVTVHEVGTHEGQPYFTLEYLDGGSLAARLAAGPLAPRDAAALVAVLASAVDFAHRQGVVHRDLKPANVLLAADGTPKIADFGLAKRVDLGPGLTQTGAIMGTPAYMAPEQAAGCTHEIGPAADTYALGAILYELLAGRVPFHGTSALDTLELVRTQEPVPPRRLQPKVPRDLNTICLKCLEKQPRRRYASAAALADDLRRFLAGEPVRARPVRLPGRLWKWARRRPLVAALTVAVVVATLAGLGLSAWGWHHAELARGDEATQRDKAEEAERRALKLAGEEARARAEEARQRAAAEANLYCSNIPHAQGELQGGRPARALELLNECPAVHRRWEWRYLKAQLDAGRRTFIGPPSRATQAAYSPDGTRLAVAYPEGGAVLVWDVAAGKLVHQLTGHMARVTGVAYTADGKQILSAAQDGKVRFWDAATGAPGRVLRHNAGIVAFAVSADGTRLALGDTTRAAAVRDIDDGSVVLAVPAQGGDVASVALSADGGLLAVGRQMLPTNLGPPTAAVWDVATGRKKAPLAEQWAATTAVAFSPDGRRLAAAGIDHRVRLFDVQTGKTVPGGVLTGHGATVASVAFSPDGRWLASSGWDRQIRLWDTETLVERRILSGHDDVVSAVAFSPDGRHLASGAWDGLVNVWDLDKAPGPLALVPAGASTFCVGAAFGRDGTQILSANQDGVVRLWDVTTREVKITFHGLPGKVRAVALSGDGRFVAAADIQGTVKLWEAGGRQRFSVRAPVSTPPPGLQHPAALVFTPDGGGLVWADAGGAAAAWDTADGRVRFRRPGPGVGGRTVALSADGRRLAWSSTGGTIHVRAPAAATDLLTLSQPVPLLLGLAFDPTGRYLASADRELRLWDLTTGRQVAAFGRHGGTVADRLAFSPDGRRLASVCWVDNAVRIWDVPGGRELLGLPRGANTVSALSFSPDGRRLALAGNEGLRVWDAVPGRELVRRRGDQLVLGAAVSADGRLVASTDTSVVAVWERATGRPVWLLPWWSGGPGPDPSPSNIPASVAFSPDGRRLAVGGGGAHAAGQVQLWDVSGGRLLHTLAGHGAVAMGVAFSPDGTRLASASHDKTAKVWDVAAGKELLTLTGHTDRVNAVAFHPDGRSLATGSRDKTVKLWDPATGRELRTLAGHNASVASVSFGPGGRLLAVATVPRDRAKKGEVAVWDLAAGRRVRTLQPESGGFYAVAFHPDGQLLAAAGDDRVIHIWEAATGREVLSLRGHEDTVMRLAFPADGRSLVSCSQDRTVRVWDLDGLPR